jgi:hypothetical protein
MTTSGMQLTQTRDSLHTLAEHVLAAARYRAAGRIGLEVSDGGFATPAFGKKGTVIAVRGSELVVTGDGPERRGPITTLGAAAELAGVEPGAPADVYEPATVCDPDAILFVDDRAAAQLSAWFALGDRALRELGTEIPDEEPSPVTLWPEHFDVAIRAGGINYGASPGDEFVPEPYLYVGPGALELALTGTDFWNLPFGAAATWAEIGEEQEALGFFRHGRGVAREV